MKTALTTIAAFALGATAAFADQVCMSSTEMQSSLIDWYGEEPVAGPTQDNVRLWVSNASGTWTLVRTLADGNACVEAQGTGWNSGASAEAMLATIRARTEG